MNKFETLIARQPKAQKGAGSEYLIRCPFHNDSTPSLGVNVAKGLFLCYGCGEKGNAVKLTKALMKGISWKDAADYFEPSNASDIHDAVTLPDEFHPLPPRKKEGFHASVYITGRGIAYQQAREFGLGYCVTGYYANRIIIPIYTNGKLQTFIARDYTGQAEKKVKYPKGSNASAALFGYDRACALNLEVIVVSEGWADALAVWRAVESDRISTRLPLSRFGAVALGTDRISPEQLNLLKKFNEFIVLLDNDKAGKRAIPQVANSLSLCGKVYIASLKTSKDPGAASPMEIVEALGDAYRNKI
jgi:DNA primase